MFLRGMWQAMQEPPAPVGEWWAWAWRAAGGVYWGWQAAQTWLPAGVARAASLPGSSGAGGSWQGVQDMWRAQPPRRKSRASPEVMWLPPGSRRRWPASQVWG